MRAVHADPSGFPGAGSGGPGRRRLDDRPTRGLAPCVHRLELRPPSEAAHCFRFDLGEHSFLPEASAANAPELLLEFPRDPGHCTLRGVVLRAVDRTPLKDAIVLFECQSRAAAGLYRLGNEMVRTDEEGRFAVVVPRTPRRTLRVYETWTVDGLVHEEVFEDDGLGEPPPLEVIVE